MAQIIRLPEVMAETGLSRSSVYRLVQTGEFPPPIKLSIRASGWDKGEVDAWKQSRMNREAWRATA